MGCDCSWCLSDKRIGTLRQLQTAECSRAKSTRKLAPTHRHLLDKLNSARTRLINHIDGNEDYKAFLIKRYGEVPKHCFFIGSWKWYGMEYAKALRAAQKAGINVKA